MLRPYSTLVELYSDGEMSFLISNCFTKHQRHKFYCVNQFEDPSCFKDVMFGMEYIFVNKDPVLYSKDFFDETVDYIFINSKDPTKIKSAAMYWYSKLKISATLCIVGFEAKIILKDVFLYEPVQYVEHADLCFVDKEGKPYGNVFWRT